MRSPDLSDIHQFVDAEAAWVSSNRTELPTPWEMYLSNDLEARRYAGDAELASIEPLFPSAVPILRDTLIDAFVVHSSDSAFGEDVLLRVLAVMIGDESYAWISKAALAQPSDHLLFHRAAETLRRTYIERFDGLCDMFLTGGLLPLSNVHPVTSEDSGLEDADWITALAERTLTREVHEIANNGGGIHALVDLSRTSSDPATAIWVDDEGGIEDLNTPLFAFVDGMMRASLEVND